MSVSSGGGMCPFQPTCHTQQPHTDGRVQLAPWSAFGSIGSLAFEGLVVCPALSMMNHNCAPNCYLDFANEQCLVQVPPWLGLFPSPL